MQLIYTYMIYAYTVCILHFFLCNHISGHPNGVSSNGWPPNHQSKFDWVTFFQMESDVFVAGRKLKRSPRQAPEMSSFSATYPMLTWDPMGDIWWSKISAPWLAIDGWFPSGDIANNGWVEGLWQLYVMLDEVNQMGTHPCTGKCVLFD
jgi:hypothetical protein